MHVRGNMHLSFFFIFFFNDTATTEIYTLSLHDALPICYEHDSCGVGFVANIKGEASHDIVKKGVEDRKSTRLNSSHSQISYAVFCLKKKKTTKNAAAILIVKGLAADMGEAERERKRARP